MSNDDWVMLSTRVPPELKRFVDADERDNQEVVRAALWREFGGEKKAAMDRRIEEIDQRISMVAREKNERDRELEQLREDKEALLEKREQTQSREEEVIEWCLANWSYVPDDVGPGVENQATKADMEPEELLDKVRDRWGENDA
jgi:DNA repair exonuclease SbcCD ATPase subunit